MSNQPIKCASKEFTSEPFHLIQKNRGDRRYVVSLKDKTRIRILLSGFINSMEKSVQLKIRDFEEKENPVDYVGTSDPKILHEIMTNFEDVIYHNGYHDLMIRDSKNGEYIVFDEHGLIFIYTQKDYSTVLNKLNAPYRKKEKLTYEFGHFHYRSGNGQERLAEFISTLKLIKE